MAIFSNAWWIAPNVGRVDVIFGFQNGRFLKQRACRTFLPAGR